MRGRYPYVVLAVLIALASAANILFTVHQVRSSEHQFCSLLTAATANQVQRPADPAANPAREAQWEWQQRYLSLSRSFGC